MLNFLDIFFLIFHSIFTLFNLTGWMIQRTRKLHIITLSLTAFSWFILGIWYGWGYCFCTDWHWQVRMKMGKAITSNSYIHFLIKEITGINFSEILVANATLIGFIICSLLSVILNIRDWKKKKLQMRQ